MWIIVATVLLLYVLGLLFICFRSTDHRRMEEDDDVESPSSNTTTRGNTSNNGGSGLHHHHRQLLQRYYQRMFFSRLVSSSFQYDDQEGDTSSTSALDPARSSLFAYRQCSLREIQHDINEMRNYLLGAKQHNQSDDRIIPSVGVATAQRSFPVPIFGRSTMVVQPQQDSPYSFVYQMASASSSTMTSGVSELMRRDSCCNNNTTVPITTATTTSHAGDTCFSSERQRRLRQIRMELACLADGSGGSAGTTLRTSNLSSLIYLDGGEGGDANEHHQDGVTTRSLINAHGRTSWAASDDEDDLPGYESILCYELAVERIAGSSSSEEQVEDTPPPSYSEAVHLYSFAELEGRRK